MACAARLGSAGTGAIVHQAAGMWPASVAPRGGRPSQVDISVADALARLRAHTFTTNRHLAEVTQDLLAAASALAIPVTLQAYGCACSYQEN